MLTQIVARFVDDFFVVFNNDSSLDFLSLCNSQHKNIKFIMELALQCILFANVCIKINNDNINTRIWCKPTHTGLLLNFNANCPNKKKI